MHNINLVRNVTLLLDSRWRPIDGFCRLQQNGEQSGAAWYHFSDQQVTVEGVSKLDDSVTERPFSQQFTNTDPYLYLGLHPLQGDALITQLVDDSCPGEFVSIKSLTNSISENGNEGIAATALTIDVAYLGLESISVTAGTFSARKYALRWRSDWPPAYVWVRSNDPLFLKMTWSQVEYWYELTGFSEVKSG